MFRRLCSAILVSCMSAGVLAEQPESKPVPDLMDPRFEPVKWTYAPPVPKEMKGEGGPPNTIVGENIVLGMEQFLLERAKTIGRTWLADRFLQDLCDKESTTDFEPFPETCKWIEASEVRLALPGSNAFIVDALRQDLASYPAKLYWSKNDYSDAGFVMTRYLQKMHETSEHLEWIAGLPDTKALKDQCGKKNGTCDYVEQTLYRVGMLVRAFLKLELNQSPTIEDTTNYLKELEIIAEAITDKDWKDAADKVTAYTDRKRVLTERLTALQSLKERYRAEMSRMREQISAQGETFANRRHHAANVARLTIDTLNELIRLHDTLFGPPSDADPQTKNRNQFNVAVKASAKIASGQYSEAMTDLVSLIGDHKISTPIAVALALADAKNPDDVKATLEQVTAPADAWKLKDVRSMVSIGALVGGQVTTNEVLKNASGTSYNGKGAGLFAPVGLDLSHKDWNMGLMLTLVDFGNLANSHRDSKSSVDTQERSSFRNLLSYGVYAYYRMPQSPIRIGAGYSYSPELREAVTTSGSGPETRQRVDSYRFSIFVAIDVTLLPLR